MPAAPSLVCVECGAENREGIRFCEQCGAEINPKSRKKSRSKRKPLLPPRISRPLIKTGLSLLGILGVLFVIGLLTNEKQPVPGFESESGPLVFASGYAEDSTSDTYSPGDFQVTVYDETGIDRVEIYADGYVVAAQNFDGTGQTNVEYTAPLENLPIGEHEVIVNAINTDGQSNRSQAIPIVVTSESQEISASTVPLSVEPAANSLPPPTITSSVINGNNRSISIEWDPVQNAGGYEIHVKSPNSPGLIFIETVDASVTTYRLPINDSGIWEIFIIPVDQNGRQGGMGSCSVFVPEYAGQEVEVSSVEETISYATLFFTTPDSEIDSVYAYVRLGGDQNLYERIPEDQNTFLEKKNGGFSATVSGYEWSVSQDLKLEVFLYGWADQELIRIGYFERTLTAQELQSKTIQISNNQLSGVLSLTTHILGTPKVSSSGTLRGFTRPETLPPPYGLRLAISTQDCAHSANQLGDLRNVLTQLCQTSLMWNTRNFLMWKWPEEGEAYQGISEQDITGFEIQYQVIGPNGTPTDEKTTSIPYPEARSYFISLTEIKQEIPCWHSKAWRMRAVGPYAVSPWVVIGSTSPVNCTPPAPTPPSTPQEPIPNGCGGDNWTGEAVYDGIFHEACNSHDKCYVSEWSGKSKVTCDNEFYDAMVETCDREYSGAWNDACKTRAMAYYEAVNIAGGHFYNGDIAFLDCWRDNAYEPFVCSVAAIPGVQTVIDGIAYGISETGELVKLGAIEVKDGIVHLGGMTWDGLKWTGNLFCEIPFIGNVCD